MEYAKYEETERIRQMLKDQFGNTEYYGHLEKIEEIYGNRDNKKVLCLDSLKHFGRKDGLRMYNRMKQIVV